MIPKLLGVAPIPFQACLSIMKKPRRFDEMINLLNLSGSLEGVLSRCSNQEGKGSFHIAFNVTSNDYSLPFYIHILFTKTKFDKSDHIYQQVKPCIQSNQFLNNDHHGCPNFKATTDNNDKN